MPHIPPPATTVSVMRETMSIQKAAYVAEQYGDQEFIAAVESAKEVGLSQVDIIMTNDDDIIVGRPQSIMIAFKPDEWDRKKISLPTGEPASEIHLTLLYLGDLADFTVEQQRIIVGVVTEVAQRTKTIHGTINQLGRFMNGDDEDPLWISGDFVGLREFRDTLVAELRAAGIEWEDSFPDYTPHITIGWIDADAETPPVAVKPFPLAIDNATVYIGGVEYRVDLDWQGRPWDDSEPDYDAGSVYQPVLKSQVGPLAKSAAKQFTMSPWYVPDSLDLHKEWATKEDVQEALWKYVDSGDRDIRLQHEPDIVAGRWVELATIPFPMTVPVTNEEGVLVKQVFPAGTPFMGVLWNDWAWELVEKGVINGLSIGGTASRIVADLPAQAAHDAAALHPAE